MYLVRIDTWLPYHWETHEVLELPKSCTKSYRDHLFWWRSSQCWQATARPHWVFPGGSSAFDEQCSHPAQVALLVQPLTWWVVTCTRWARSVSQLWWDRIPGLPWWARWFSYQGFANIHGSLNFVHALCHLANEQCRRMRMGLSIVIVKCNRISGAHFCAGYQGRGAEMCSSRTANGSCIPWRLRSFKDSYGFRARRVRRHVVHSTTDVAVVCKQVSYKKYYSFWALWYSELMF